MPKKRKDKKRKADKSKSTEISKKVPKLADDANGLESGETSVNVPVKRDVKDKLKVKLNKHSKKKGKKRSRKEDGSVDNAQVKAGEAVAGDEPMEETNSDVTEKVEAPLEREDVNLTCASDNHHITNNETGELMADDEPMKEIESDATVKVEAPLERDDLNMSCASDNHHTDNEAGEPVADDKPIKETNSDVTEKVETPLDREDLNMSCTNDNHHITNNETGELMADDEPIKETNSDVTEKVETPLEREDLNMSCTSDNHHITNNETGELMADDQPMKETDSDVTVKVEAPLERDDLNMSCASDNHHTDNEAGEPVADDEPMKERDSDVTEKVRTILESNDLNMSCDNHHINNEEHLEIGKANNKYSNDGILSNLENNNNSIEKGNLLPPDHQRVTKTKSKKRTPKKNGTSQRKSGSKAFPDKQYNVDENDDIACEICGQKLDNNLKFYNEEETQGFEEELAIIDSRLLLFDGDEKNVSKEDTRAYNKLTNFSVYCKNGHLCSFDSGVIEKDLEIFFSGYVKAIYSDDPSTENGVPGKHFGPIAEWWITGFDMGEEPTIGISTELGDYILMKPSDEYIPFMYSVVVKILLSKTVIEYLVYTPYATYEDLLYKLQNTKIPGNRSSSFTEDTLLQYAPFICDQVMSFDETGKPDEPLLAVAPCIRRLINLAGISYKQPRQQNYRDRRTRNQREELLQKLSSNSKQPDNPTRSELINRLLPVDVDKVFTATALRRQRRNRCGVCDRCQRPACADCPACAHHEEDLCAQRRCFYREIEEANDQDANESLNLLRSKAESSLNVYKDTIKTFIYPQNKNISWVGEPIGSDEAGNTYYRAFKLDGEPIALGDFVFLLSADPDVSSQVVKVAYVWEDAIGEARFHAQYYWWGEDTILGDVANENDLFAISKCGDLMLKCAREKAKVQERFVPRTWSETGDYPLEYQYFCEKSYDFVTARFQDLQRDGEVPRPQYCQICVEVNKQNEFFTPMAIEKLEEKDQKTFYSAVLYKGETYKPGNSIYLKSKSLYFKYPMMTNFVKSKIVKTIDDVKYPEYYTKSQGIAPNIKLDIPAPFDIGYITEIFMIGEKLYVKVKKFYRPENTQRWETLSRSSDINKLYWSDEESTIEFSYVIRKCYVAHEKNLSLNVNEWSNLGPDRFYFTQAYKGNNAFFDVDRKNYDVENRNRTEDNPKSYPEIQKLKTLDIFAGCGGLSLGLKQAKLADNRWAIESDKSSAFIYELNSPDTKVWDDDPGVILNKIMNGETIENFPEKNEVELICTSLSRDNFRGIDNISAFRNSRIATFISYCDYYKPLFLILETDEKIVAKSIVLKLILTCLVGIGYQVSFNLLQSGNYGAPLNRRRCVILGAAPEQKLPNFPKHLHVFPKTLYQPGIVVDNKMYTQVKDWTESAPYRAITIREAMSDLPPINVGEKEEVCNYLQEPVTTFQKKMRKDMLEPTLFDHVCKDLGVLVKTRIALIPLTLGSDWRDLPNIEVQLNDGSFTRKLIYKYKDGETSRKSVCKCCTGAKCDFRDRQEKTLIPWHLAHSAKRHAHWAGLYGRLQWEGFFPCAFTNPEPLGEKGPVIHPSHNRLVSVRECARAQGFPDDFIFSGEDRYRQIGMAASPLLALAIGREVAFCVKR